MKLLIIGLDGLDPFLVDKWRMNWFKQVIYGKHYVGFLKTLYTPIVWSCFLTGKNVERHGYDIEYIHEERAKKMWGFLYPFYLFRKKIFKKSLGIRKLLIKTRILREVYTPNMPNNQLRNTFPYILKELGYSVSLIEVPGYNERRNEYFRTQLARISLSNMDERKRFVEEALLETLRRTRLAYYYVKKDYDLIFIYSPLPDLAFHVFPKKPRYRDIVWLRSIHFKLYKIIRPLVEYSLEKKYRILIISDHGFDLDKLYHSNYGFWSFSQRSLLFTGIKTIMDFKNRIITMFIGEKRA